MNEENDTEEEGNKKIEIDYYALKKVIPLSLSSVIQYFCIFILLGYLARKP